MEIRSLKKIAILGAESTGKSWLSEQLAAAYSTTWVPEYAREYFNHSDIYNYTLSDLEYIAAKQVEWELKQGEQANALLFCDTALLTLKIWAELEFGHCPASILERMDHNRYDYYLIANNEVPWEQDAQRQNKYSRELIFQMNIQHAKQEMVPFGIVEGLGENRLKGALKLLSAL